MPKLIEKFTAVCRTRHLRLTTERAYWYWVRLFVKDQKIKSEAQLVEDMPADKFAAFISAQAMRGVTASTQNQAFNALLFLYREVLGVDLGKLPEIQRAKRPSRLPNVPSTHADTMRIVQSVNGDVGLALRLTYGAALRISDALRIRLKDLDFSRGEILIRGSKGDKDRVVPLPASLEAELRLLVARREMEHAADKKAGHGWVHLPHLLGKKYPKAHHDTQWQYLFGARGLSVDPVSGNIGRTHLTPEALQAAMRRACAELNLKKTVTPHGLRHAAAREIERRGGQISEIQKLLGHSDVNVTMRYLGAGSGGKPKVVSPLD